ncbi:MAG: LolA-like putative outer membrane lipoprotein chaperone [Bacteroidales bacterium]|nr:LolA-like putative outer membrane lipoprotein chaperone [Bacteroidales bacterium]
MKKLMTMAMLLMVAMCCQAQNATQIFDRTVAAYKAAGAVSANYSMGSSRGTIVMKGSQFRILANNLKSWYDGKTQWTYSVATDEVNVSTPSAQQLVMVNPLAAAQTLKSGYSMSAKKNGSGYVLTLKPKAKSNVTSVTLYISSAYVLTKAVYTTKKGSETLTISNYKTKVSTTAATFKFDKMQVPAGTEVVDLR